MRATTTMTTLHAALTAALFSGAIGASAAQAAEEVTVGKDASVVTHDPSVFKPDPSHEQEAYDPAQQLKIYGDKQANENPRPPLELGRPIYDVGPYQESSYALGRKNPINHQFAIYGDWRAAVAYNDNGSSETGQVATTLNLDIDWKLTATERFHAVITPLEKDGRFTRHVFSGAGNSKAEFDSTLDALFFEGDLGAITSGLSDKYTSWDLPFAVGLMPLQFQNGIWLDDAFTGVAFTIPARNSAALNISNMDVTFFAGFDKVSTALSGGDENDVRIYGATAFIEANSGYWEIGYGYTDGHGGVVDQDYHNLAVAFSRRYGGWLSNSVRVIHNFGQDNPVGGDTADGTLLLVENSFITSKPSTLIPYLNLFAGFGKPQSLARGRAAGGILRNTGILFESDNLTGYPTLDASGNDTFGAALGVEYLFALNQQLVVEAAALGTRGDDPARIAKGSQWGLGVRYQRPINRTWIVRADAMMAQRNNDTDLSGIRLEIRKKF